VIVERALELLERAGHRSCGLLVLTAGFLARLIAGLPQMLLQLGFCVPAAVADGPGLFGGGMAVPALPRMVIHASCRHSGVVHLVVFTHTGWSHMECGQRHMHAVV
jgi:hypothetical protein